MSDETTTEAPSASDAAALSPADSSNTELRPVRLNPDGTPAAPRKRRRGSRGGRSRSGNLKTPGDVGQDGDDGDDLESDDLAGEDWTDAAADRGLTTDDIAADAFEEAGLREPLPGSVLRTSPPHIETEQEPPAAPARPKIGDTRPAPLVPPASSEPGSRPATQSGTRPATQSGTRLGTTSRNAPPASDDGDDLVPAKRRRSRGGRGRGKSAGASATSDQPVTNQLPGVRRPQSSESSGADGEAFENPSEIDPELLDLRRGKSRKGRPAGRYFLCAHVRDGQETQLAVLEGRSLTEYYVGRPSDDVSLIDGNIYLGRVQSVLPGMEAAFVDIGTPKNGVLYRGDVAFDPAEADGEVPKIERILTNGQSIMIQVIKNPIGAKGARLTQEVSLAGRFVVLVPDSPSTYGISKRLGDNERKRLRKILEGVKPEGAGLIVRTAAEGATAEELTRDVQRLTSQWAEISALAARSKAPKLLYREPALAVRVIREEFTKEYRGIAIDDADLYNDVKSYIEAIAPELSDRVEFYDAPLPIFEHFNVHEQLVKALDRKVWLPSGGSIIIEHTEALTVIDVNTGKNVGKSNLEETVFKNNLEAAEEIARQLRLRDVGGIIVIDFIDMEIRQNRDQLLRSFKEALARDKTRTQVFEISELGLVQMTRKRVSEGLVEAFSHRCDSCNGRGLVLDRSMME